MDIRIRPAGRKDMDLVWKATLETVWQDVPADERSGLDRAAFERHFRPNAERVIDSEDRAIFVAEGDGGVLGYTIVGSAASMLSPRRFGFIYDLWVAPPARRQGVAHRLLVQAEAWCREHGLARLKLEVAAANGGARALYESEGFAVERLYLGKTLSGGSDSEGNV